MRLLHFLVFLYKYQIFRSRPTVSQRYVTIHCHKIDLYTDLIDSLFLNLSVVFFLIILNVMHHNDNDNENDNCNDNNNLYLGLPTPQMIVFRS